MEIPKFLFSIFLLLLLPFSNSINFQFSRFDPNSENILFQGDAVPTVGAVELINKLNYLSRVGRVIYADQILLWDSTSEKLSDFTTRFSFTIDILGQSKFASGLAFFLAPAGFQIPPNSAGGFLGLFNTSTTDSSSNQIVAVEFDTYNNPEWDPVNVDTHVGINKNSISSAEYTAWNASFHSGDKADVVITYNSTTKNLSVSWSYQITENPLENSTLWYQIDLTKVLPEWVTIGISAATSQYSERSTLQSWEFTSNLDPKESGRNSSRKNKMLIGIIIPAAVLLIGAIAAFLILREKAKSRRKKPELTNLTSMNDDFEQGTGPRRFSYHDLAAATNNFSEDRKLGEGGFGAVFRGYFSDQDLLVAVKKISKGSRQGKKEYVTEVKVISQLRHRNLVQLIGWCHQRNEFLLVYEFMPNGSLDSHLFGKRAPLSWTVRYRITLGLASAILYLHEEWEQCVVHRDIKSSNIMLDSNFNVKLGDFGLAKLMDHELGHMTTGLAGTLGYLAPEYISTRRASKESDVFSFGVVILEIVTGRKSMDVIEDCNLGLVEWVWDLYGNGSLGSGVDERLRKVFDENQAECLMVVGLWCAHPDSGSRPSVRQAIQVLNFEAVMPELPEKIPVPVYHVLTSPVSSGSGEPLVSNSSLQIGR